MCKMYGCAGFNNRQEDDHKGLVATLSFALSTELSLCYGGQCTNEVQHHASEDTKVISDEFAMRASGERSLSSHLHPRVGWWRKLWSAIDCIRHICPHVERSRKLWRAL